VNLVKLLLFVVTLSPITVFTTIKTFLYRPNQVPAIHLYELCLVIFTLVIFPLRKMELSFVIWIIVLGRGYIAFPVAKVFLTVFNKLIE